MAEDAGVTRHGRWLKTTLAGSDISIIKQLVMGGSLTHFEVESWDYDESQATSDVRDEAVHSSNAPAV